MQKQWQRLQPDTDTVETLCQHINCNPVTATILVNRKIVTAKDAIRFLNISLKNLRPPFSIKGMDIAVERIIAAITHNQKILIFGDYDVDGITATAILLEFFRSAGLNVSYYIPHRLNEGYSLQPRHIMEYAVTNRIDLIITADRKNSKRMAVAVMPSTS
ncbi:DHH family phosphoesterase [Thermodesulfobacteriota bacterium]